MGATVFNMPDQICEMVRYTEYITRISKSELYRKAISYFIENRLEVTDEVLYMPLAQKNCKEQVYIEMCLPLLEEYIKKLRNQCAEGVCCVAQGKGIMQKKNRYLYYLYSDEEVKIKEIEQGLIFMNERRLVWKRNGF